MGQDRSANPTDRRSQRTSRRGRNPNAAGRERNAAALLRALNLTRSTVPAAWLRRRGLRGTRGIGCRKAIDQSSIQPLIRIPVERSGMARFGGVFVMRARIELVGHG